MSNTHVVLLPGVMRTIRCEAFRAWRSLRRFGFDPADAHQELLPHFLGHSAHYDELRSSIPTFASHVCRHRTLQLVEAATSAKRGSGTVRTSLSEPAHAPKYSARTARLTGSTGGSPGLQQ
jgi:hypothetical protein